MLRKTIFAVTTVVALAVIALAPTSTSAFAFGGPRIGGGGHHFSSSGHLWFIIGTVVLPALAFILRRWFGVLRQEPGGKHPD